MIRLSLSEASQVFHLPRDSLRDYLRKIPYKEEYRQIPRRRKGVVKRKVKTYRRQDIVKCLERRAVKDVPSNTLDRLDRALVMFANGMTSPHRSVNCGVAKVLRGFLERWA